MRRVHLEASVTLLLFATAVQAGGESASQRRAQPPQWSTAEVDVFFEDARKQLVGARPVSSSGTPLASDSQATPAAGERAAWSARIGAESLASEVKQAVNRLAAEIAKPGQFNSGGYLQCRRDFSLLAVLLRVVEEYDGEVRWQRDAAVVRGQLELAAILCESPGEESYAIAKKSHALMSDLLRGQPLQEGPPGEHQQVDRAQLMQRLEASVEETISPSLANKSVFRRYTEEVGHESQVLAVLAKVILDEGYDYADDQEFVNFAHKLSEASVALAQAAQRKDYESARAAAGRMTQSCSQCHESYRG